MREPAARSHRARSPAKPSGPSGTVFGNVILHNALLPLAALPAGGFVIVGILAAIWCAAANLYTDYKHEEVRRLYADRKH